MAVHWTTTSRFEHHPTELRRDLADLKEAVAELKEAQKEARQEMQDIKQGQVKILNAIKETAW